MADSYPLADVSDIEQELARQFALQIERQLLIYPGYPRRIHVSIVPPLASVGSIVGRLAVNAGRPLSKEGGNPPEVTWGSSE
jgi:hypothetical protein